MKRILAIILAVFLAVGTAVPYAEAAENTVINAVDEASAVEVNTEEIGEEVVEEVLEAEGILSEDIETERAESDMVELVPEESMALASDISEVYSGTFSYINPIYEDVIEESDLVQPSGIAVISDFTDYASSISEAGTVLRSGLEERAETIEVLYQTDTYDSGLWSSILSSAVEHTGVPTQGDYLRYSYVGYVGSWNYYISNGIYYLTFVYTMTYSADADQENEVTEKLESVMASLDLDEKSNYEKISAVYDYICENVTYDYTNLSDSDYILKYSAYAALINGTSVCQGYAALLYRMLLEAGIDTRIITGTGNGGGHAWNIVKLGSVYYNVDATWDAVYYAYGSYVYFLQCDSNFAGHTRDDEFAAENFYAAYPMSETDYDADALYAPEIVSVYSTVQTSAKITWTKVDGASGYQIYRSTEEDGTYACAKTITSGYTVSYTNSGLTVGQTYYYKVRAYKKDSNGSWVYSDFSDVRYMPAAVVFDNVYSNATYRVRLLWDEVDGVEGYQIWRADSEDGAYKIVKTITDGSTTAYSNTGLESGQTYYYKMRAYTTVDGSKVFGAYSDIVAVAVMPETPEVSVVSYTSGIAKLSWDEIGGAAGYQIWRSDSSDGTYTLVKSITDGGTTAYSNSGLTSTSTYYYKVRAYSEVNGKKTFGAYSDVQRVTVK